MYAGPGSGPMMAAAAAWDEIAAELGVAASSYNSVVTELTSGPWVGPASASMLAAITPYVSWLSAMAAQAEETAGQGRAAAAAFEAAFAMTVPPPVIAANRVLLATLIATNFFGQNTPAIMATEAQYMEMWAQDAAAMAGYTAASMAAALLAPFATPPNTSTPEAGPDQAAAVAKAVAEPAGNTAQTTSQVATPQALSLSATPAVQAPAATTAPTTAAATLPSGFPSPTNWWSLVPANYDTVLKRMTGPPYFSLGLAQFSASIAQQRSEEHTSELQSHVNLVCRLLLEKKKTSSPPPSRRQYGTRGSRVRPVRRSSFHSAAESGIHRRTKRSSDRAPVLPSLCLRSHSLV